MIKPIRLDSYEALKVFAEYAANTNKKSIH